MKRDPLTILHLNLHREFFAQIAAGTKRIEYCDRTLGAHLLDSTLQHLLTA